jgi:hypothetical protein
MNITWGWLHESWVIHAWYIFGMIASLIIGRIIGKSIGFKDVHWGYIWAGVIILAVIVCGITLYYLIYQQ